MEAQALQKAPRNTVAFAFDIDGVFVNGTNPIPGARETLIRLQNEGIPYIFLTNSGGVTEKQNLDRLDLRLGGGLSFSENQIVQSHTPFRSLVSKYQDKTILVLGGHGDNIRSVAHAYGFRKVVTSSDVFVQNEHIHPFPEIAKAHHLEHGRKSEDGQPLQISAILVWSSPRDWCLDLQLILDLLLSSKGVLNTRSKLNGNPNLPNKGYLQDSPPELFFCNPDFEWSTKHVQPRLAQGAFCEALRGLWNAATEGAASDGLWNYTRVGPAELDFVRFGKPTLTTYNYGERALMEHIGANPALYGVNVTKVWMVGDNPASDIAGANAYRSERGIPWGSILVETGVHRAGTVPENLPDHTAKYVQQAVEWAITQGASDEAENEEDGKIDGDECVVSVAR